MFFCCYLLVSINNKFMFSKQKNYVLFGKRKIMALKIKVQNNEYHQTLVKLRERND